MFVMLFGYPPFHAESDADIFRLILAGFDPVTKKGYKGTCTTPSRAYDAARRGSAHDRTKAHALATTSKGTAPLCWLRPPQSPRRQLWWRSIHGFWRVWRGVAARFQH